VSAYRVPARDTIHESTVTLDKRLSAALRAQASGLGTGSPTGSPSHARKAAPVPSGDEPVRVRLPGRVVLALAVLLGLLAGGLAGVISTW
jgi:hypothetical protein